MENTDTWYNDTSELNNPMNVQTAQTSVQFISQSIQERNK